MNLLLTKAGQKAKLGKLEDAGVHIRAANKELKKDQKWANVVLPQAKKTKYVWHHDNYNCNTFDMKMVLVLKKEHNGISHAGAYSDYSNHMKLNNKCCNKTNQSIPK